MDLYILEGPGHDSMVSRKLTVCEFVGHSVYVWQNVRGVLFQELKHGISQNFN